MTFYEIGKKVQEYRKERNISQEKLADACNISRATLSKLENNKLSGITLLMLIRILDYLNKEIEIKDKSFLPTLDDFKNDNFV